jgi:hypothetical protein
MASTAMDDELACEPLIEAVKSQAMEYGPGTWELDRKARPIASA